MQISSKQKLVFIANALDFASVVKTIKHLCPKMRVFNMTDLRCPNKYLPGTLKMTNSHFEDD